MKLSTLKKAIAALPANLDDDSDVVIWLPGSIIDLSDNGGKVFISDPKRGLMIEGNVRPGSALDG